VRLIDGRYRVIDIMVAGISMAVTQRSEFASVARRGGLEGLMVILRDRTTKISKIAALN
jgi:phospholipid transport system substrate-binding protein